MNFGQIKMNRWERRPIFREKNQRFSLEKLSKIRQFGSMLFVGIDPGNTGGIAGLDERGRFVFAHRWTAPQTLFDLLLSIRGEIDKYIYLELVQTFPQMESGFQNQNQGLLVNLGIWQGLLYAARIDFELISPLTWQAAHGLTAWSKRQLAGEVCHSPLTLARSKWPGAPLPFRVDDGKAAALLLADLARQDREKMVDRRALRLRREAKEKLKRQKRRQAKKEGAAQVQKDSPQPTPRPQISPTVPTPTFAPGSLFISATDPRAPLKRN